MACDIEGLTPWIEILGQPDGEFFRDLPENKRAQLRRQLGLIWDYTPSLWDEYMSIDDYFETIEHRLSVDPDYRRKITERARNILGSLLPESGPAHCGVEQLVACRAHNPKVAGSSPAPAIISPVPRAGIGIEGRAR